MGKPDVRYLILALLVLAQACSTGPATIDTSIRSTIVPLTREPTREGASAAGIGIPSPAPRGPTLLRMLADREPTSLGDVFTGSGAAESRALWPMLHDFLVVFDPLGSPLLRLATETPAPERGTWRVNPDGTMDTTMRLKPGVRWHDGTEFTAQDMVLGWRIAADSQLPSDRRTVALAIDSVEAPDPYTLNVHWKQPYPWADRIQPGDWDPLPSHLLGAAYAADPTSVTSLPYWRDGFVGLGPYRLASWEAGVRMGLEANDQYHLGRPKIDRIEVRFVADDNTRLATMLAGEADMLAPQLGSLDGESLRLLDERWRASGDGTIIPQGASLFNSIMPKWTNPLLGGPANTGVRQALLYGLDRAELARASQGDASYAVDSWISPQDRKHDFVQSGIVRYPYDASRASQLLREAGWNAGPDGVLVNASGQRFSVELRAPEALGAVVRESWRPLGVETNVLMPPAALGGDPAWQANYPGLALVGTLPIPTAMYTGRLYSRSCASEANGWTGLNRQCYQNPEVDPLVEQAVTTLNEQARWAAEASIVNVVTRDAVLFPSYRSPRGYVIVRKGVANVPVMQGFGPSGDLQTTYNVQDWDIQR